MTRYDKDNIEKNFSKALNIICDLLSLNSGSFSLHGKHHTYCSVIRATALEILIPLLRYYKEGLAFSLPSRSAKILHDVVSELWEQQIYTPEQALRPFSRVKYPAQEIYEELLMHSYLYICENIFTHCNYNSEIETNVESAKTNRMQERIPAHIQVESALRLLCPDLSDYYEGIVYPNQT